jgi:TetR/AcrR family transcriptional regulator
VDRSPRVNRSRVRSMRQAGQMLDAARRLIRVKGDAFTTQELAKEAGVALQTFYRYFATKDELLLTLFGDLVAEGCAHFAEQAKDLSDPIARLRFYVTSTLDSIDAGGDDAAAARFVVSAHWQLQRNFPNDIAAAMRPFADLLLTEIHAGVAAGLLNPADPERAAWLINELVRAVHHHYAYAKVRTPSMRDDLWEFCLRALGGKVA